ncbi:MAG: hypothetical protein V4669_07535 [Pseudomonadota bacterium]
METSDAGQRRFSLSTDAAAVAALPVLAQPFDPVEAAPVGELSFGPPVVHDAPAAGLEPLGPHSQDVPAAVTRAHSRMAPQMDPQMAEFVATMRIEARQANESFDAFNPVALKRTRDLLVELGRPGEAIALQRQILRFTGDGPEQLPELMKLVDLCLDGGQPLAAIDAIKKARLHLGGMSTRNRAEIAWLAALARVLAGDPDARREMRALGPHLYDERSVVLQALVQHAGGDHAAVGKAMACIQDPANRFLLFVGCNRPADAILALDEFVRANVPEPGMPLPEHVQRFAQMVLHSPIVACSPLRTVLAASDSWKRLRACCEPEELAAIAVEARLPDLKPHVLRVLTDMRLHDVARMVESMDVGTDDPYQLVSCFYRKWDDPQINLGVQLEEGGRKLLATYLNRKWGASIHVHPNMASASTVLAALIEGTTGHAQEVRTGLAFGVDHGVCAVYVRKQGKEALFFFDSITGSGETAAVDIVQEAVRKTGRKIPVYRQAIPTQTDSHSCFVQSMKAAVTLTRRIPGENGGFGEFLIPDLMGEMERSNTEQSSFDPFIPTPGVPEVAKMAQGPMLLQEHLAARPEGPLRDTRTGLSLQEFVHSHVVRIANSSKPVAVFDYTRQKGLRYAKNIDVEQWIQTILAHAGPRALSPAQQNELAARVKALERPATDVRPRPEPQAKR